MSSPLLLALAACGGPELEDIKIAETPEASASTATGTPEEVAVERAKATVELYVRTLDTVYADPGTYLNGAGLSPMAEGGAVGDARIRAGKLHTAKRRQTGTTQVKKLSPGKISLDYEPNGERPTYPSVRLTGCIDRSAVSIVGASGTKVSDPAARSVRATFSVRNTAWPDTNGWRVSWVKESKKPCS